MSKVSVNYFSNDKRGSIAIVFAFIAVPIVGFVGMAVDYGHALNIKSRLQAVTDIAASAGARLPATANANRVHAALKSYNANMLQSGVQSASPKIEASNSGVTVAAAVSVPTAFLGLIGVDSLEVHASTLARSQIQNGGVACLLALNTSTP
ncbi:MAG: pilus assembly protein, partial [Alphaproteobacteria bacterium]|nr:pilus assembly protein [Alphaproteobacteria bacterium]